MIEIPEPPDIAACATCMHPLVWMWTARRTAWVAFVSVDRLTLRFHECRPLQEPATWRALSAVPDPHQAERNAAGRAAVEQALKSKSAPTEGETP